MIKLFKILILAFLFSNLSCGLEERKITVEYIAQTQAQIDSAVSKLNVNDSVFYEDEKFRVTFENVDRAEFGYMYFKAKTSGKVSRFSGGNYPVAIINRNNNYYASWNDCWCGCNVEIEKFYSDNDTVCVDTSDIMKADKQGTLYASFFINDKYYHIANFINQRGRPDGIRIQQLKKQKFISIIKIYSIGMIGLPYKTDFYR